MSTWLSGKIVVGVDGSKGSVRALRKAAELARIGGGHLELITAWQMPFLYGPTLSLAEWSPRGQARQAMLMSITDVFGEDSPETMISETIEGITAQVLINASKNADLLVVGSRGHGGFAGLLLGSVSAAVAEHATCPVLIVHDEP